MKRPPPQCPPPDTDCTTVPSSTTHEFSYPNQRHLLEAPMGSMMVSLATCGKGRRQTLSAASARTCARTSLYLYAVPGGLRGRRRRSSAVSDGRSAPPCLPQRRHS